MDNNLAWTKTILTVYRHLERICNAIDKIVLQSGLSSANMWGQDYYHNNIFTLSQKLIDLGQRKITLINLKILIEETLGKLPEKDAQILIERYFDDAKCREIAERKNVSIRTVFRQIANAEQLFIKHLRFKGYNALKMHEFLKDEKWIMMVYDEFASKNADQFCFSSQFLNKAVSM